MYEEASADDGMRILIDRLWPRGLSKKSLKYDAWPRDLAPSNELRKWYGHDPKRSAEFRRRYRSELTAHCGELAALRAKLKGCTATLLTRTILNSAMRTCCASCLKKIPGNRPTVRPRVADQFSNMMLPSARLREAASVEVARLISEIE